MHFDPKVGYGLTVKEPATFLVYFLFMIITALRYDKKLNIYAGALALTTYITLLVLAIVDGGMTFTRDISAFFATNTLRASAEGPKILFLVGFTYFTYKMAEFTTNNIDQLARTEQKAMQNYIEIKNLLNTLEQTSVELLNGSHNLSDSSDKISGIINEHAGLMKDVETITDNISESIEQIRDKSDFQYTTVEQNFKCIKEISDLMRSLSNDSTAQNKEAEEALKLARVNEEYINDTIKAITDMRMDSQKIEEISQTISEIADKTNLLSLNAAIESARAGEHGKGFAVVADEISKLASMSIDSSKEIATIIKKTVDNIENASTMIESLAQYLQKTLSFVKENSLFMEELNKKTLKEYEESKNLYATSVQVDSAARDVLDQAKIQTESVDKITEWFDNMNHLGREIMISLNNLKTPSNTLEGRSLEMKKLLDGRDEKN